MQENIYWLISITSDSARVSLVGDKVLSQGQEIIWDQNDLESLLKAIDTSLSSQNSDATSSCAFVVPPSWISSDGKMFPEMLTNLKYVCNKLKLRPLGQISNDEAFVESYNTDDSFPSSYILLNFSLSHYQISLVYLGEIKKRQIDKFTNTFSVSVFENSLFNLGFTSALPPKIIVTGVFTTEIIEDLKNYNWLSHKDRETFLHLPDVISVDLLSQDQLFVDTIKKQISPRSVPETIIDATPITSDLEELEPSLLGFSAEDSPQEVDDEIPAPEPQPKPNITLPKLKLPHFSLPRLNLNYYWLLPLTLLPFLPVLPLFFANVDLTIYQNQVEFNETFDFVLDPKTNVSTETFNLTVGASQTTSGKKEVGEKASGEVTIFNKSDRSLSLNKGIILTDVSGKTFETTNNILLPASTYNLDTGVINMGQVKAAVAAQKIGPESNLPANSTFTVADNQNLLVKSTTAFAGGSREEKLVVTQADRNQLLESAKALLKDKAKVEINSQKTIDNTILESTMVFNNQKTSYNRQVGEESDLLTLDLSSSVSFLYFNLKQKQDIIAQLFPQKPSLSTLDKNSATVSLNYTDNKLSLTGKSNPVVDILQLKQKLVSKRESNLNLILNSVPQYYQHKISNSLWFINLFHFLPTKSNQINIILKN